MGAELNTARNELAFVSKRHWWQLLPYITGEGAQNLKKHKYSGNDRGLMYIYFYSPIANKLVDKLPVTLAPNTITLLGLVHNLLSFILVIGFTQGSFVA